MPNALRSYLHATPLRDWIVLGALSAFIAACAIFVTPYVAAGTWPELPLALNVALFALVTCIAAALFLAIGCLYSQCTEQGRSTTHDQRRSLIKRLPSAALVLIMLALWSPWLIAAFPGASYNDTIVQISQFYPHGNYVPLLPLGPFTDETLVPAQYTDHHPFFSTLIYGAVAWASEQLTGTWEAGCFIFCTVQVVAYALIFVHIVKTLDAHGAPSPACIGLFAFLCLMPAIPAWADALIKDSLFGIFFLLWFIQLMRLIKSDGPSRTPLLKRLIAITLFALLVCLTKKTGVYIIIATAVIGCIWSMIRKRGRAPLLGFACQGLACAVVMWLVVPLIVFPALKIWPGGLQEPMGVMLQQTARYAQDHQLTDEERDTIDHVVRIESIEESFEPDSQDNLKVAFNVFATEEELSDYVQLYVRQGADDPLAYADAIGRIAGQYVSLQTPVNICLTSPLASVQPGGQHLKAALPGLETMSAALAGFYDAVAQIPFINIPLLSVTYVLWIPALMLFVCLRNRCGFTMVFVPLAVVAAFCAIGPIYDFRYALPFLLTVPLLIGAPFLFAPEPDTPDAPSPAD